MLAEPIRILLYVSRILENLGIPHLTGGSIASSMFGIPRATQDIDVIIDLSLAKAEDLIKAIQSDFYVDPDQVMQAINRRSSFNAIHFETAQKIDFFIQDESKYAGEEMSRRFRVAVGESANDTIFIASPEDIILQKIVWYKMGSQVSERQWKDVLGIIKVQGGNRLDREYLLHWARDLAISDLVLRVLSEAGQS
jgi:hypothetical protein